MKVSDARNGAAITVKVITRAKKTELAGLMEDGTLKIRVAAPPVDGAANKALVEYLARLLHVTKNQIDIVAGASSDRKLIGLVGISPAVVNSRVRAQLAADGDKD